MSELSTARFIASLVLLSCFYFSSMADKAFLKYVGFLCLVAGAFVGLPRSAFHRRLSRRDLLLTLLMLLAAVLGVLALGEYWQQPLVLASWWLICVTIALWRHFRRQYPTAGAQGGKVDSAH